MKRYTAFIAPTDDYRGTKEGLVEAWQNEHPHVYHIDFQVPEGTPDRMVSLIAGGLFWEDCWSPASTVFTVVEDLTPEDTRPMFEDRVNMSVEASVEDRTRNVVEPILKALGEQRNQSAKDVDLWSNREDAWDDKVNW